MWAVLFNRSLLIQRNFVHLTKSRGKGEREYKQNNLIMQIYSHYTISFEYFSQPVYFTKTLAQCQRVPGN